MPSIFKNFKTTPEVERSRGEEAAAKILKLLDEHFLATGELDELSEKVGRQIGKQPSDVTAGQICEMLVLNTLED